MARNTSVILGDHFDQFIKGEIESGRYTSASEIIRSGLRRLEDEKKKIHLINEALIVGEESGEAVPFDNFAFKLRMKNRMSQNG